MGEVDIAGMEWNARRAGDRNAATPKRSNKEEFLAESSLVASGRCHAGEPARTKSGSARREGHFARGEIYLRVSVLVIPKDDTTQQHWKGKPFRAGFRSQSLT